VLNFLIQMVKKSNVAKPVAKTIKKYNTKFHKKGKVKIFNEVEKVEEAAEYPTSIICTSSIEIQQLRVSQILEKIADGVKDTKHGYGAERPYVI
jgi:hypothetical protein